MSSKVFKSGFVFPRVVKKLDFKLYHKDLSGEFLMVWVNLTRAAHDEYTKIQSDIAAWKEEGDKIIAEMAGQIEKMEKAGKPKKQIEKLRKKNSDLFDKHLDEIKSVNDEMYAWYAQIWSQDKNGAHHLSADEVRTLAETSNEQESGHMWNWITTRTQVMIQLHGNQHLKK